MGTVPQSAGAIRDHYEPLSRRPIADLFRTTARPAVMLCVRCGMEADWISYSSIAVSAAAGVCFWKAAAWPWLLIGGPLLCYLRLWLNMLDGMVALATGSASRRGEILNDLPDRISDILIFVGAARSGLAKPDLGYAAAIFALLTAYVGVLGQAVGTRRQYGGIMSKPWRMVVLHAGAWAEFIGIDFFHRTICLSSLTWLDYACAVVILGCVQTIAVRLRRTFAELKAR